MNLRLATNIGAAIGIMGFLTGVLLFFVLTACSSSGSVPAGGGSTGGSVQQQARAVWLDYANCVRSHGFPDFPDPVVDSKGQANFGNSPAVKSMGQRAQGACGSILGRLPAAAQGRGPVTAAELHQETLFAGCLRRHGLPDWPDPQPDGTFRLAGTPYIGMGKGGPVATAMEACRQYDTFGGIPGSGS